MDFFGFNIRYLLRLSGCCLGIPLRGVSIGLSAQHAKTVSALLVSVSVLITALR